MKKPFILILFFIFSSFLFAAKINKANMSSNNLCIEFSSANNEDYLVSVDEDTRLMYIELLNLEDNSIKKLDKDFEEKVKKSAYFENVTITKENNSVLMILQLVPKISFFIDASNKKIDISLNKASKNKHLIVIDPGHGGKDPGAVRGNIFEKNIAFAISNFLKDELSEDFNVLLTREKDIFIKLNERPRIANNAKAKLFVSIHANASESSKANGFEVFYFSRKSSPYAERIANFENSFGEKYGENSDEIAQISGELAYKKNQENSIILADNIAKNVSSALNMRNGGSHGANFAVLRGFNGPGILVEVGFVSNSYDRAIITDYDSQRKMAHILANAIKNYFN